VPGVFLHVSVTGPAALPDFRQPQDRPAEERPIRHGAAFDTMLIVVRLRLVLLVTIAALLAPWVTPCLMTAPAGHAAMPCCQAARGTTPAVRPCCALDGGQPATPVSANTLLPTAMTPMSTLAAPAIAIVLPRAHAMATMPPSPSRRLSTILLI